MVGILAAVLVLPFFIDALEVPRVPLVPDVPGIKAPHHPASPRGIERISSSFSSLLGRACEGMAVRGVGRIGGITPGFCEEGETPPPPPPPEEEGSILINEIMYSPDGTDTDHEWVEVWNGTDSAVDLTDWVFADNQGNHGLALASGVIIVDAGEYFVIADDAAQFLADYPDFAGVLFQSSFSLANSGETISVKNAEGEVVDEVTYAPEQGADGDGDSLQRTPEGAWEPAAPTPGGENVT